MKHRPYKLLNASELSAIGKRVEVAWGEWTSAWLSGDGGCDIRCSRGEWTSAWLSGDGGCDIRCSRAAESGAVAFDEASDWMYLDTGDGQGWALHCATAFRVQLGAALIPAGADEGSGGKASALLADLVKSALADFLLRLDADSPGTSVRGANVPDAQTWDAGSGAAVVKIGWGGETLTVSASAGLTATMLASVPPSPMRTADFEKPVEALANASLKLNVLVGEAQLELALLQTIAIGDVIKLDARIDEPLQVVNAEGVRLCGAFLGSSQGRKSVQLTKLHKTS